MTNTITSSMRLYKNTAPKMGGVGEWPKNIIFGLPVPEQVAVGVQRYKHEVTFVPHILLKTAFPNLKKYSLMQQGGHFAGWENPQLTADHFVAFVKSV